MLTYIIRRILLLFPTLIGVTALVFFVMAMAPGGIGGAALASAEGNLEADAAQALREYYERRYGLDKPVVVQYGRWVNQVSPLGWAIEDDGSFGSFGFKTPDLGISMSRHRPVVDLVAEALPITVLLNVITIPIIYFVAICSGIIAARERGKAFDLITGAAYLGMWSVPTIWAGVMFIGLLANEQFLKLFPTSGLHSTLASEMSYLPGWRDGDFEPGYLLDTAWHLVLPVLCLVYGGFAFLAKLSRASILENLNEDFVRTARAKGVTENVVLFRHVFRNSLLALITVAAGLLPALFAGSIIVETIFSLPGMGQLGVEAVQYRDRELVLAVTLVGGLLALTAELIRDICYAIADPRVSYE